ncbi:hypothetical protein KOR42_42210 [Thalassoglobus neptunius]|uniref:Glycosyl hydrolase family 98 putative carbohydrate-binding module domain-containing protein n=1 Tax=Thalassoglobus neptunius TaxID=1938619 RepID=A0A5C5W8T6_9PLAN|nr:hypothetical protein [Thalassoglobus neptunius]TWT47024.1 hypothetical protein KOR42_42210 [Thalassoglobus neptunius]
MKSLQIIILVLCACVELHADDLLFPNADFEQGTLENWTAEGEEFRIQPTRGDNTSARNREPSNLQGNWWIGGYERYNGSIGEPGATAGDHLTGTLTSREFEIKHPYITFRIGAGHLPGEVGVRLLVDGESFELATGVNHETMVMESCDVRQHIGKRARLQIFDTATGGWGHINVDDFRGTESPAPETSMDFVLDSSSPLKNSH